MEGKERGTPSPAQAVRELAQKRLESAELVVDLDAKRLEHPADGELDVALGCAPAQRVPNRVAEISRRPKRAVGRLRHQAFREQARRAARRHPPRRAASISSTETRASHCAADRPRAGFIRMSSGPSCLNENPRAGSSSCIDDAPRSAKTKSAPSVQPDLVERGGEAREVRAPHEQRALVVTELPEPRFGSSATRSGRRRARAAARPARSAREGAPRGRRSRASRRRHVRPGAARSPPALRPP